MTDKELLELASKAAGISGTWERDVNFLQERWRFIVPYDNQGLLSGFEWNPLTDDGDEARLEASLGLDVEWHENWVYVGGHSQHYSAHKGNKQAARRYAGVIAAAEIGKGMK